MAGLSLGNSINTTFGYWGIGGAYDTSGGYYGRLWEIKSANTTATLQQVRHTWDAGGNLVQRAKTYPTPSETENFGYDFLDRLTSVSGAYSDNWTYSQIGNINTHNGTSYGYGNKPHAVTSFNGTSYQYDEKWQHESQRQRQHHLGCRKPADIYHHR
ncbi:MAG: hypothetical protein HYX80_01760 [Chloroflexi bacterium]|nr:hypothetical protein [Chloroflexota bacterium]